MRERAREGADGAIRRGARDGGPGGAGRGCAAPARGTTGVVLGVALFWMLAAAPEAAAQETVYRGTATVTLGVNNYCDVSSSAPQRAGVRTFSMPVTATVAPPQTNDAGHTEPNPLHLTVSSNDQVGEGGFLISSAQSYATSSGSAGLAYWSLEVSGSSIQGTLTNSHRAEAAALNMLSVSQDLVACQPQMGTIPMVSAMGEGTQLAGTLGDGSGSLRIQGRSTDGLHDYQIDVDLSS